MLAPNGANLGRINARNAVKSLKDLAELCGYIMFLNTVHSTSTLQASLSSETYIPRLSMGQWWVQIND